MDERQLLTAAEVAAELGVSLRTVRRWIAVGRLSSLRVGRAVRVPRSAFLPGAGDAGATFARETAAPYGGGRADTTLDAAGPQAGGGDPGAELPWPLSRALRLEHQHRLLEITDRIRARSRPPSGPDDSIDALLGVVRDAFSSRAAAAATGPAGATEAGPLGRRDRPAASPAGPSGTATGDASTAPATPPRTGRWGPAMPTDARLVVDASVAVRWFMAGEPDGIRARVLRETLAEGGVVSCQPLHFALEVAGVLLMAARAGRLHEDDLPAALNSIADLRVFPIAPQVLAVEATATARQLGLRVADAAYLVCARQAGAILVTADRAQHDAALEGGYAVAWLGDMPEQRPEESGRGRAARRSRSRQPGSTPRPPPRR